MDLDHSRCTWLRRRIIYLLPIFFIIFLFPIMAIAGVIQYNPSTDYGGYFVPAGDLITARALHTATVLQNGKILVTGGANSSSPSLASAELWDPATKTFSPTGSMNTARIGHTATLLPDGRVFIAGGTQQWSAVPTFQSAEIYDPVTGVFTYVGNMRDPRYGYEAILLPNGKVLLIAGSDYAWTLTALETFDPANNAFNIVGYLNTRRADSKSVVMQNNKILISGGWCGGSCPLNSAEVFDPATGVIYQTSTMSEQKAAHTATLLSSGKVLIAGGTNFSTLSTIESFNPISNTFTVIANLSVARFNHTATTLGDGRIIFTGGINSSGVINSVEIYDPITNISTSIASMAYARSSHTASLLSDGKILYIGGNNSTTAELYIPETNVPANSTDSDADGYTSDIDCDDTNPAIHPGVIEICNNINDNCDNQTDEGFPNLNTVCSAGTGPCVGSGNYVCSIDGTGTVCNATPGLPTPEVCDQIDNDCDGVVDEGVTATFYRDQDNDGYGDTDQTVTTCTQLVGYVSTAGDCNDNVATIHPGATEIPGDGIDQDCDGGDIISQLQKWEKVIGPWNNDNEGFFTAIASHPDNPDIVYIGSGTLGPGVYKTTDGGKTWEQKNNGISHSNQNYPPISKIAISSNLPNVLYLGTAVPSLLCKGGCGKIYKSTNAGDTWTEVTGTRNWLGIPQIQGSIGDLAVHPKNPNIVYAGLTAQGIFKTIDGGVSWEKVYDASVAIGTVDYFNVIRISPLNHEHIYISGFEYYSEEAIPIITPYELGTLGTSGIVPLGMLKSSDGGNTWQSLESPSFPPPAITDLEINSSTGNIYVSTAAYQTPVYWPVDNKGIYTSITDGITWQSINNAFPHDLVDHPILNLTSESHYPKRLFASAITAGIFASSNGGNNWNLLPGLPTNVYFGDTTVIGNKLFVLTSNGIYVATIYNTPPGTVLTTSSDNKTTVTFSEVVSPGNTILTTSDNGPFPPVGFYQGSSSIYYNIETSSTYISPIYVCIPYDKSQFNDSNKLHLFHYDNNAWIDITTLNDLVNDVICGKTNKFSIFAIFEADTGHPVITAFISPLSNTSGWNNSNVTVIFTCSDSESGIATCTSPITITAEGKDQVITGAAIDKAGNSASTSMTINLDKTPPILTCPAETEILAMELTGTPVTDSGIQTFLSGASALDVNPVVSITHNAPDFFLMGPTSVTFMATDIAGNQGMCQGNVIVIDPPPVFEPLGDQTVNEGQTLEFVVSATDPNDPAGVQMAYSVAGLPQRATFDPLNRIFSYTPGYDVSTRLTDSFFDIFFTLSDGTSTIHMPVRITVYNVNRPPVANAGVDLQLECAGSACPVILDATGSIDPDSTSGTRDDIADYRWYEGYGTPDQQLLGTGETIVATLSLGNHTITLVVTDQSGAAGTDTVDITLDPARLSMFMLDKAEVDWPKTPGGLAEVKFHGKLALPAGLLLQKTTPVAKVGLDLAGQSGIYSQAMNFEVKGDEGEKWEYKSNPPGEWIQHFFIHWKGARFDYKGIIHLKTEFIGLAETALSIEREGTTGAVTLMVNGVSVTVDEAGLVTTSVPYEIDEDGEVTLALPFELTSAMEIMLTVGVQPPVIIRIGDYYTPGSGSFELKGKVDPEGLTGTSRPATLGLSLAMGIEGFPGFVSVSDSQWDKLSAREWKVNMNR